jgi:hypothetical protein
MVAWIKSDGDLAQRTNTTYVLSLLSATTSTTNITIGGFIYLKIDMRCS